MNTLLVRHGFRRADGESPLRIVRAEGGGGDEADRQGGQQKVFFHFCILRLCALSSP